MCATFAELNCDIVCIIVLFQFQYLVFRESIFLLVFGSRLCLCRVKYLGFGMFFASFTILYNTMVCRVLCGDLLVHDLCDVFLGIIFVPT